MKMAKSHVRELVTSIKEVSQQEAAEAIALVLKRFGYECSPVRREGISIVEFTCTIDGQPFEVRVSVPY